MKGLETELRRRVRGEVRFDPLYRALYATDASLYQIAPAGVEFIFAEHADKAVHRAQNADAIVLVVCEYPYRSGENSNVSDLSLPPGQAESWWNP